MMRFLKPNVLTALHTGALFNEAFTSFAELMNIPESASVPSNTGDDAEPLTPDIPLVPSITMVITHLT
jgi:hypothetical protein